MDDFIRSLSLHLPIYALSWQFTTVLLIAAAIGIALGLYCRFFLGAFLVWGLVVGFVGSLVLWLLISVLALKWALLLAAALALVIFAGFYLDEQTPVTGAELVAAAAVRDSQLAELFSHDNGAAESIADALNLGLDEAEPKWPSGHFFAGIPRRVTENLKILLIMGFGGIGSLALVFHFLVPAPNNPQILNYERSCTAMPSREAAECFMSKTALVEAQLMESIDTTSAVVYWAGKEGTGDQWKAEMSFSLEDWFEHRDRLCKTQRFLLPMSFDATPYIARCRLRMTVEFVGVLAKYGSGKIVR